MALRLLTIVALAAAALAAPLGQSELYSAFSQYKQDFAKVYADAHEEALRFEAFSNNLAIITEHNTNKAATEGYTMGINQFTDWTSTEYSGFLTYNAKGKTFSRVKLLNESLIDDSVDWRTKGAVTPVKNQQSCGSCWAFSTTGSVEGALAISTGKLVSLSEQELVDCAGSYGNQGCNGGLMDDGFKFIEAEGDSLEDSYKYTAATGTCSKSKESSADGVAAKKIESYSDVTPQNCAQMKAAVSKGPVSVAIEADQSGFQHYSGGIFSGTCGTTLDHGVLVVGYGSDAGKDYWIVKNSWGTTWGDEGYIKMVMGTNGKGCAASNGRTLLGGGGGTKGECGILAQPSYPEV